MKQRFESKVIVGMLIWIGLISACVLSFRKSFERSPEGMSQLVQYVSYQRHTVEIEFPDLQLIRYGDPVFRAGKRSYSPIGFVSQVDEENPNSKSLTWSDRALVTFYGNAPAVKPEDYLEYHLAADTSGWVLKTMLPPKKREEIAKLIMAAYTKNQIEIVAAIRPVVEDSLRDVSLIVRTDLENAFAKREAKIRQIGEKYQSELIEEELVPLIESEIWPIVQQQSEPLAAQIGQEIWQEVSVFRFGWRYLYDRSPLPEKKLAEREFDRFLDEKLLPILRSHLGDFLELQQDLVRRISENEEVKKTFAASVRKIVGDPEIQQIFSEVFQEVLIDNRRLQEAIEARWTSPKARQAIQLASQRLEPTITDIGVALFGSPRDKITPEFARTIRHRILHKDDRWFTLHTNSDPEVVDRRAVFPTSLPVKIADPVGEIPFAPARERN
jgi:hypothetical protein